jgi:hypothetical protein
MEAARRVQISFDEQNQIRLLDPDSFKATEALAEESVSFVGSESSHNPPPCAPRLCTHDSAAQC